MRRAAAIALAAAALALPGLAPAADDLPIVDLATDEAEYEAQKQMWQERFREAREAVAEQRARHQEAVATYKQMRHRRRERGAEKQKILDELTDAEVSLEAAQKALQELFESARRAGVPPGWTQMPRGESPAAPEAPPDK